MSEKEFREYADECFGWAKTAKSEKERLIFLQMAETWLQAAVMAEAPRPSSQNLPVGSRPPDV